VAITAGHEQLDNPPANPVQSYLRIDRRRIIEELIPFRFGTMIRGLNQRFDFKRYPLCVSSKPESSPMTRVRFKYSLRMALFVFAFISIALGTLSERALRQRRIVALVREAGGDVWYDYQRNAKQLNASPGLMRKFGAQVLGWDFVSSAVLVRLRPTPEYPADQQVKIVADMPYLRELTIWPNGEIAASRSNQLDPNAPGGLTDYGVQFIVDSLSHLQCLDISAARITDDSVRALLSLPGIEVLQITRPNGFGCTSPVKTVFGAGRPEICISPDFEFAKG
jgi:hypothetical protein